MALTLCSLPMFLKSDLGEIEMFSAILVRRSEEWDGADWPASGGPIVIGTDMRPKRQPRPCAAPVGPSSSTAIGPIRQMKQPSHTPISSTITTSVEKSRANGMQAVAMPMKKKAACCIWTRLTPGMSATLPHTRRLTPDVTPTHMTRISGLAAGITSRVCFTCDTRTTPGWGARSLVPDARETSPDWPKHTKSGVGNKGSPFL